MKTEAEKAEKVCRIHDKRLAATYTADALRGVCRATGCYDNIDTQDLPEDCLLRRSRRR